MDAMVIIKNTKSEQCTNRPDTANKAQPKLRKISPPPKEKGISSNSTWDQDIKRRWREREKKM
jgi:hypothetical protein